MPAKSEKQRKMVAADHERLHKGEKTRTGMSEAEMHKMMRKPKKK